MTWATRTNQAMDNGSRPMPPDMRELVAVRALRPFELGEKVVAVGEILSMQKHRADYLRFLQIVEWV